MKTLKLEIVDPTGIIIEESTQTIDFHAGPQNTVVISIGNYVYNLKNDGELICRGTKSYTPYD